MGAVGFAKSSRVENEDGGEENDASGGMDFGR